MSILSEIKKNSLLAKIEAAEISASTPAAKKKTAPPKKPCACNSRRFWLDAYGGWNCFACDSPRNDLFVKDEYFLERETQDEKTGNGYANQNPPGVPLDFVVAVFTPDEPPAFADWVSQADRRRMIEDHKRDERIDARLARNLRFMEPDQ